jgi:hypothetical protein
LLALPRPMQRALAAVLRAPTELSTADALLLVDEVVDEAVAAVPDEVDAL